MRFPNFVLAALFIVFSTAGAVAEDFHVGDIVIEQAWSRATPSSAKVAAGYLKITNHGTTDDKLVAVGTEISGMAMVHHMSMENDVMKMEEVKGGLPIPAGSIVELKPQSYHIMFMGLNHPLKQGDTFTAELTFEKAGKVTVTFEVGPIGGQSAPGS